jgi:hypothetical protein
MPAGAEAAARARLGAAQATLAETKPSGARSSRVRGFTLTVYLHFQSAYSIAVASDPSLAKREIDFFSHRPA